MILAALFIAVYVALAVGSILAYQKLGRPAKTSVWLESVTLRKVVLHLDTDASIEGFVGDLSADGIMLRTAIIHDTAGRSTEVEGDTWVPRERVVFAQGL